MTQITPFQVPTFEEQASQLAFDTYITDDEKTAIHYRISSEKNTLLISSNFILTDEEFNA